MNRVLIIEPHPIGHGPLYLECLLKALRRLKAEVSFIGPTESPGYAELLDAFPEVASEPPPVWVERSDWDGLSDVIEENRIDAVVFTYLDSFVRSPGKSLRKHERLARKAKLIGFFFWPYWQEYWSWELALRGKFSRLRRIFRIRSKSDDWFELVFVLDDNLAEKPNYAFIPDPWTRSDRTLTKADARASFSLPEDRLIFLHFGVDDPRKGLHDCIEAFEEGDLPERALLLRVGETGDENLTRLMALESRGRAKVINSRIPEDRVDNLFSAVDYVLLPYRSHRGSSGLLSIARAHRKPVIASDFGMIGRSTRQENGGHLFPNKRTRELRKVIATCCSSNDHAGSWWTSNSPTAVDLEEAIYQQLQSALGEPKPDGSR